MSDLFTNLAAQSTGSLESLPVVQPLIPSQYAPEPAFAWEESPSASFSQTLSPPAGDPPTLAPGEASSPEEALPPSSSATLSRARSLPSGAAAPVPARSSLPNTLVVPGAPDSLSELAAQPHQQHVAGDHPRPPWPESRLATQARPDRETALYEHAASYHTQPVDQAPAEQMPQRRVRAGDLPLPPSYAVSPAIVSPWHEGSEPAQVSAADGHSDAKPPPTGNRYAARTGDPQPVGETTGASMHQRRIDGDAAELTEKLIEHAASPAIAVPRAEVSIQGVDAAASRAGNRARHDDMAVDQLSASSYPVPATSNSVSPSSREASSSPRLVSSNGASAQASRPAVPTQSSGRRDDRISASASEAVEQVAIFPARIEPPMRPASETLPLSTRPANTPLATHNQPGANLPGSGEEETQESLIRISIGRVVVRAAPLAPSPQSQAPRRAPRPALSLGEYLKKREGRVP
jgi:hypothetical protein